nr:RNHCP domain-containing protein [Eubacterium pyruvativorans]
MEPFTCRNCGWPVSPEGAGSGHRNHCPNCLCSLHVDVMPGDRGASCHGIMDPVGVWVRSDGEWAILHRCRQCGKLDSNRTAADDNPMKLMALALKPFTSGEIGRERLGKMTKTMEDHAVLK